MRARVRLHSDLKRRLNSTMRCSRSNSTKASEMLSMASARFWWAVSARMRASLRNWLLPLSSAIAWFSASVRSRTCSASSTECRKAAYGASRPAPLDSTGSIRAALMRASVRFARSSSAWRASRSTTAPPSRPTNGDTGEGLVDVHAIDLLSVGVEADHLLAPEKSRNLLADAIGLDFQAAQEAVAANGEQRRPEALFEPPEQRFEIGHQRAGLHGRQHDAVLHRAVEGQAQVVVYLLDRAHVVLLVDTYRQGMRGEQPM